MGEPVFKIRHLIQQQNVQVFSSNYALYGDMSQRVMIALAEFTPEIEIYSIDEAFLDGGFCISPEKVYFRILKCRYA